MIQSTGKIPLYNLEWSKFVDLIKETYCPQNEVEKVESDFLSLVMKNMNCRQYVIDFNSLSRLVPYLITLEPKRIARFIGGLVPEIKGHVKASKPTSYRSVVDLSLSLTLDVLRNKSVKTEIDGKRKREDDNSQKSKKKGKFGFQKKKNPQGSSDRPVCKTCNRRHEGQCRQDQHDRPCGIYKKKGHKTLDCKDLKDVVCYGFNEKGHIKTNCPKNAKKPGEAKKANAWAFQMNAKQTVNDDNVVTCTVLINDVYARVLFDSGADKSFVDLKFSKLLNLPIRTLDITYETVRAVGCGCGGGNVRAYNGERRWKVGVVNGLLQVVNGLKKNCLRGLRREMKTMAGGYFFVAED
ncbi:uncharacterized protein LOC118491463 [Helianthus annuus]|uniref:uncharacterized protein LOC118491463 n=1 Tax=Helianthus annuus TaxID=4232 RepID=UPI0016531DB3|nr:uncharacterized protein LOC118491463 [Helianthus annuus]